jgi:hypothetical protein
VDIRRTKGGQKVVKKRTKGGQKEFLLGFYCTAVDYGLIE